MSAAPPRWLSSAEASADPDLRAVMTLELALLDPRLRADPAQVRALLHPHFREFGASGRSWDADSTVSHLAADPGSVEAPVGALGIEAYRAGPDAVLLTYRSTAGDRTTLRSSLWVRTDGAPWRLLHHQGTPVPS